MRGGRRRTTRIDDTVTRSVLVATETRPWGRFTVIDEAPAYKVKRIEVRPGLRLSYQRHAKRSEHWIVVSGVGEATLDDVTHRLSRGDTFDIPVGGAHRIANVGDETLVFIEVQHGESFDESDIERIDDDFGRAG